MEDVGCFETMEMLFLTRLHFLPLHVLQFHFPTSLIQIKIQNEFKLETMRTSNILSSQSKTQTPQYHFVGTLILILSYHFYIYLDVVTLL